MYYWHTIYFTPSDSQELFLVKTFRPHLEKQLWTDTRQRAYFQRVSTEQGNALVLSLFLPSPELDPTFLKNLSKKGELLSEPSVQSPPDEPLSQRWIREFQHIACRVVLDLISKPSYEYSDARLDLLKLQLVLLRSAGLDKTETADYCNRWLQAQLQSLGDPAKNAALVQELEESIQSQFLFIKDVLEQFYTEITATDLSKSTWLRWIRGTELIAKGMEQDLERYLPLLLNLCSNQMGIYPKDELSSLLILSRALSSPS